MSLRAGTRLGPYEILSPIGAGGMGEVYRARDTRLHRDVAVKMLHHDLLSSTEHFTRFLRESRMASASTSGMPQRPNPPDMMTIPSFRMPAKAAAGLGNTLFMCFFLT